MRVREQGVEFSAIALNAQTEMFVCCSEGSRTRFTRRESTNSVARRLTMLTELILSEYYCAGSSTMQMLAVATVLQCSKVVNGLLEVACGVVERILVGQATETQKMLLKNWRVLFVDTGHLRRACRAATRLEIIMLQGSSLMILPLNFHDHLHQLLVYRSCCSLELCIAQLNITFAKKRLIRSTFACCLHYILPNGATSGMLVVHGCQGNLALHPERPSNS